jgi:hypothetical protein
LVTILRIAVPASQEIKRAGGGSVRISTARLSIAERAIMVRMPKAPNS